MSYNVPEVSEIRRAARENGLADASGRNREKAIAFISEYRDQICEWAIERAVSVLSSGTAPVASVTAADVAEGYVAEHATFEDYAPAADFPLPLGEADADRFRAACSACLLHDVARAFSDAGYPAYAAFDRVDVYLPAQQDGGDAPAEEPPTRGDVGRNRPAIQPRG